MLSGETQTPAFSHNSGMSSLSLVRLQCANYFLEVERYILRKNISQGSRTTNTARPCRYPMRCSSAWTQRFHSHSYERYTLRGGRFLRVRTRTVSNRQQLLRAEWFPATVHQPQTCATLRVLEHFHALTLTGKLSAHEFYKALECLTDNTELAIPKVISSQTKFSCQLTTSVL